MVETSTANPFVDGSPEEFPSLSALTLAEATEEVELLREAIRYHDYRYYIENDPVISDQAYDELFSRLQALETEFDLMSDTSPTQRVGGEPIDSLETVDHVSPMLSLDSSESVTEVKEWDRRIQETIGETEYSLEPKFDGVSVEVVYEDGMLDRAVTRGDGERGDNITHNVRTIGSVPLEIKTPPEFLALRGEIYMPRSAFHELNEERIQEGKDSFANPRNAAAGTVRQLDPSIVADRPLEIYFYDVLETSSELTSQAEAFALIQELGLRMSTRNQLVTDIEDFIQYREEILDIRDEIEVETDGVVVKVNDYDSRAILGATARHPRWAFAYKFPANQGETTVRRIVVQVGRTGKLTPVALLDPVDVTGVTISRATLHNESIVQELGVSAGATVTVERAGDVIPEIAEVIEAGRGSFAMPDTCPVCGSEVVVEGEHHFCTGGTTCPAQLRRTLEHFCSRDAMDIEGVGEKTANQLVETGLVDSIADLYSLTKDELGRLEAFGDTSASNLLGEIESSKEPRLDRFIYALGIRHVGSERARQLARAFSLDELLDATEVELVHQEDIGPEVARSVSSFFENAANRKTVHALLDAGVEPTPVETQATFTGLRFVFTGSIEEFTRSELTDLLEQHGATVTSSVSGATDYLVQGNNPGQTKLSDARDYGVEIITADEFRSNFLSQIT